jgi:membrane protease YdiL (CAAX protease family)
MLQFALILFFIYFLPVFLLWRGWLPTKSKILVLSFFTVLVIGLTAYFGFNWQDLGLRTDNLTSTFWPYTLFTLAGLALIRLLAWLKKHSMDANWRKDRHFQFLFLPISFFQEFIYRGFFWPLALLALADNFWLVVLTNTLVFTWLHILYPDKLFSLSFACLAGLGFAVMYWFFPNLILISLSHAVLNFAAVLYGFFNSSYQPKYAFGN